MAQSADSRGNVPSLCMRKHVCALEVYGLAAQNLFGASMTDGTVSVMVTVLFVLCLAMM